MNLKYLKFTELDNESIIWEDGLYLRQNIQKYTIYLGIAIYVRYENYKIGHTWYTRKTTYSLDKRNWTEDLVDIQKILKRLGK